MLKTIVLGVFVALCSSALGASFYVSPQGQDANDGLSPSRPVRSVQAAVDKAQTGDEVRILTGTYLENVNVTKGIILRGGYRANFSKRSISGYPTIIDGSGRAPVINAPSVPLTQTVTVDGLTLQNGTQGFSSLNTNVTFTNNTVINNNLADNNLSGAGVCINGNLALKAAVTGNLIADNHAVRQIGGLLIAVNGGSAVVSNNQILRNSADVSIGGVFAGYGTVTIDRNLIAYNATSGGGAGLYIYNATLSLTNNRILYNTGGFGTAAYINTCKADVLNNLIARNYTPDFTSALAFRTSDGRINGNTIVYNTALWQDNNGDAVGIFNDGKFTSHPEFANNILAYNWPIGLMFNYPPQVQVNHHHNCYFGQTPFNICQYLDASGITAVPLDPTELQADPLFVDPDNDDFRLQPDSPARGKGTVASLGGIGLDLDLQPRTQSKLVDMGAYQSNPVDKMLFGDTFKTSAPVIPGDTRGEDINFEYQLRQYGSLAPIPYTESSETSGPLANWMTQVFNLSQAALLISCYPTDPDFHRPNTSVALNKNLTSGGDFEVTTEPGLVYPLAKNPSHWLGFSFGDPGRVIWPSLDDNRPGGPLLSDGTGYTIQKDGSLQVYDSGQLVYQSNIQFALSAPHNSYTLKFKVHTNPSYDGTGTTIWTLYVGGRPKFTYRRARGYVGNYMTAAVYSDPSRQLVTSPIEEAAAADLLWKWEVRKVDATPPSISALPSPTNPSSTWYTDDVQWTLSATDDVGGSGVREIDYSCDLGATWTRQLGSKVTVSPVGEGSLSLQFYAVDNAGNVSSTSTVNWNVDRTAPVTKASFSGQFGNAGWFIGRMILSLKASDSLSGVAQTYYRLNGGTEVLYKGPVVLPTNTTTLTIRSVDRAGNSESPVTQAIKFDVTLPTISTVTFSPSTIPNLGAGKVSSIDLSIKASDVGSGISGISYAVTDALGTSQSTGVLILGSDGLYHATLSLEAYRSPTQSQSRYTVTLVAQDLAGNKGNPVAKTLKVQ